MIVSDKLRGRFWEVEVKFMDNTDNFTERTQKYITYGENHAEVASQIDRWYSDLIPDLLSVKIEALTEVDEPYVLDLN